MFFEKMSDLAGDITFDERKVDELYTKCCAKYELKIRRKKEKLLFYDIYSRNTSDLYVYHFA